MDRILPTYARCIKQSTIDTIHNWVDHGWEPGGFMTAVICNDLKDAVSRADCDNIQVIPQIVMYLYNCVPASCWGSPENFSNWKAYKEHQRKTSSGQ